MLTLLKSGARNVLILAFLTLISSTAVYADSILIGGPGNGSNAFPFGAPFTGNPGTRYQQAYAAADFQGVGPILITSIDFFRGIAGNFAADNYTFYLSTITAGIDTLSDTNFDSNRGANNTFLASMNLSGPAPAVFTISGFTPFLYDPSQGNLLLDMVISPGGGVTPPIATFLANSAANGIFSRYHNFGAGNIGFGLVTEVDFTRVVTPVPEPGTFVLLATGILGIIGYRNRRAG
jgi:hypothetical protein